MKYSMVVAWSPQDGEFVATSEEFPDLSGLGPSQETAVAALHEAIEGALEILEQDKLPVPEPRVDEGYSGQFRLRVPKSLHASLVHRASREGVSLNSLVIAMLSEAQGRAGAESDNPLLEYSRSLQDLMGRAQPWYEFFWQQTLPETMAKVATVRSTYLVGGESNTAPVEWRKSVGIGRPRGSRATGTRSEYKLLKEA